jgi:hypothetical protein
VRSAFLKDGRDALGLENIVALLVLFLALKGLVVLPADQHAAPDARDVADRVLARRHRPVHGLAFFDVDDLPEEEGFALPAAEVL